MENVVYAEKNKRKEIEEKYIQGAFPGFFVVLLQKA